MLKETNNAKVVILQWLLASVDASSHEPDVLCSKINASGARKIFMVK